MKTFTILVLIFGCYIFSFEDKVLISGTKIPCSKICGDGRYECRATGIGSNEPTTRVYKKERPDATGKTLNNLGRSNETKPYNNVFHVINLNENEVIIDTAKIDYDLKKDNLTELIADLDASLKKNKIKGELALEIKNEYKKVLDNNLVVKANVITYTMTNDVIDSIRDVMDGNKRSYRYEDAYARLKSKNRPLIRQVKVIEEVCNFKEHKDVSNLLRPLLSGKIVNEAKVNLVIDMTKQNKKTSLFNSSYNRKSIYSYGYWNEPWMYKE